MAGRPPDGVRGNQRGNDGLLLDLEDSNPLYNDGQRPPVDDEQLQRHYDYQNASADAPRPSTSYDEFVNTPGLTSHLPQDAEASSRNAHAPYVVNARGRTHSQGSGLGNYRRYSDADDFAEDDQSYYQNGGDLTPGINIMDGHNAKARNSVMSMGGGMMGRAKVMLGMGPKYSEMDLPLTEHGAQPDGSSIHDGQGHSTRSKGFDSSNFKFGLGRGKPDPSTLGPRMIYLNNPPANKQSKFVDNHVSTAKFNIATFLPKFLFEQFSRYANLFFLFTAALQQIPNISPTNRYTTIVPLIIVLMVSAGKELVEDYKRRVSDRSLNYSKTQVLRGSSFETARWIDVAVGDIIKVESEESFPADLVLVASSEPEGLCYIETANLDGETNLKIKQAIPETATLVSPAEVSRLTGRVRSEQPNSSLYTYEATLTMQAGGGEKELALAPDQLLLRGALLRNTAWVYGIVVFTGHETKLMRNATATPIKRTAVERQVNLQILMLVGILLGLSIISSAGDLIVRTTAQQKLSYLEYGDSSTVRQFFSDILTYWVLFSNLVPISLFVTVEGVKYFHAFLINSDLDMYYDKTDTPAICRTSSLVEELGQIEYVFSDKTGTLTCNQMDFKQCSIAGIQYAEEVPEDRRALDEDDGDAGVFDFKRLRENQQNHPTREAIHHFLALLATCHTVIPRTSR